MSINSRVCVHSMRTRICLNFAMRSTWMNAISVECNLFQLALPKDKRFCLYGGQNWGEEIRHIYYRHGSNFQQCR